MADNISQIQLPNAAGTTTTYNIKHTDAADLPITTAELDGLFEEA